MILLLRIQRKAYFSYYFDSPLTMILIQKPQLYIQDAMAWLKKKKVCILGEYVNENMSCYDNQR